MRWFFLLFLLLAVVVCNAAVFEQMTTSRVVGGVALNLILAALVGIWWSAYNLNEPRRTSGLQYSISLLLLGCGVALCQHSLELLIANECPSVSESGRSRLLSRLFNAIIEAGHCKSVLAAYLVISGTLLLTSVRTFHLARQRI